MNKKKILESDLGNQLQLYLEELGYDCYPEAQFKSRGRRADIIALKPETFWVIEIKKNINITLLEQAYYWHQNGALQISVAVERPVAKKQIKKRAWISPFIDQILREYGIGLLLIDTINQRILEPIKPKNQIHNQYRAKLLLPQLDQRMKLSHPGAKKPSNTPASRSKENILNHIDKYKNVSLSNIIDKVDTHHYRRIRKKKFILDFLIDNPDIEIKRDGFEYIFTKRKNTMQ